MKKNPLSYGIAWEELAADSDLISRRRIFIADAARKLEQCKMARFDERSGNLYVTDLGRVASHYYIRHDSIVTFNEHMKPHMTETEVSSFAFFFLLPGIKITCLYSTLRTLRIIIYDVHNISLYSAWYQIHSLYWHAYHAQPSHGVYCFIQWFRKLISCASQLEYEAAAQQ